MRVIQENKSRRAILLTISPDTYQIGCRSDIAHGEISGRFDPIWRHSCVCRRPRTVIS